MSIQTLTFKLDYIYYDQVIAILCIFCILTFPTYIANIFSPSIDCCLTVFLHFIPLIWILLDIFEKIRKRWIYS